MFFLITFAIYYIPLLKRFQIYTLILASTIFYAWSAPWLLLLLIVSVLINAFTSYWIHIDYQNRNRLWAWIGVLANLGILILFKYNRLIGDSFHWTPENTDGLVRSFILLPLPIGISFYTFQGISLVVDTYKTRGSERDILENSTSFGRHLRNTTFFKVFFPQLISGPIVKAHDFYFQIGTKFFKSIDWGSAGRKLILGYFLKMVVADNLKDQTFWISYPYFQGKSSVELIVLLFGYSFQIFSDFAGYSLIALGLAELLGYRLIENFNFPYISRSFSEFWRRWHISLSEFLRLYLYIPLGGNQRGSARTYLNLFIVMFLGGLWHGAAWSYAIWGTFHGLLLAAERLVTGGKIDRSEFTLNLKNIVRVIFVFSCVTLAWLLFRLPDFSQAIDYLVAIKTNLHFQPFLGLVFLTLLFSVPPIVMHLNYLFEWDRRLGLNELTYAVLLFLIICNAGSSGAFIYFQF